MNLRDVKVLFEYNDWANQRLLDAVATLSTEQLRRDLGGSYKTVRDLEAHIVSTEWAWLERWGGVSPTKTPDWVNGGDIDEIIAELHALELRRSEFLWSMPDADLSKPIEYHFLSGEPGVHTLQDLMIHVVNHSTYHRGQLASMLRQLGAPAPSTDFVLFKV